MSHTDYCEIEALGGVYIVPLSIAIAVHRALERCSTPDWIEFHDVFGSRHRMLALCVYRITECSRETLAVLQAHAAAFEANDGTLV